jgi:cytochrome bd ubiquinol oxidase subunit I
MTDALTVDRLQFATTITFAFGVATGVPMEFQFGTNWANFSQFAGGVIGQTLALEGVFAFFLESSFLGVMLAGEKRVGRRLFWASTLIVFFAAWLSAYFILATNAWMQYPVGYRLAADGTVQLESFFRLLTMSLLYSCCTCHVNSPLS